jgi:hypothetical protein
MPRMGFNMYEITKFAQSKTFFDYDPFLFSASEEENLWKRRLFCFSSFLQKLLIIPFALFYKGFKSLFRAFGVLMGFSSLFITLGVSPAARRFFLKRMEMMGSDLGDWVLLPFAVFLCLFRLILASTVAPRLYA